jgi:peptide/nickel transport system substrate-binding protein
MNFFSDPHQQCADPARRDALRRLGTAGILLSSAGLLQAAPAPRRGGSLTIATQSSSTADTLDPAKAALSTDYLRAHMFYNGLTTLDPNWCRRWRWPKPSRPTMRLTWTDQAAQGRRLPRR